jgi:hypothetical protein
MIPTVINHGKYGIGGSYEHWAGGSCGCRLEEFNESTLLDDSEYGITIWPGKHGEQSSNERFTLDHVETSAGTLTIGLRHELFKRTKEY